MGAGMKAEIVRADEIRVGDKIVWCDAAVDVKTIDSGYYHGVERIQFNALCVDNLLIKPSAKVARILPEPVEVREFWEATSCSVATEGTEQECRNWIKGRSGVIEHVRITVLSREEVKND
jgi:hypothetical protein